MRYAAELGYEVTVIKDATASFRWEEMTATLDINLPSYAEAILTTEELLQLLFCSSSGMTSVFDHGQLR